jgi:hypothetical protein
VLFVLFVLFLLSVLFVLWRSALPQPVIEVSAGR